MTDESCTESERQVEAEAVRRYGYPITDIEAIEFHLLKEQIRAEKTDE